MAILIFILVLALSWVIGAFAWAQIIGSIQNFHHRFPMRILTILIWGGIITGSFFLMKAIVPDKQLAWIIGMAVSFIMVLFSGKIQ